MQAIEDHFATTFERPSAADNAPVTDSKPASNPLRPITPEEVRQAKTGWKRSAPGPDGVTTDQLKRRSDLQLAVIFNTLLFTNTQLPRMKVSRTTLIYKKGERADLANWRPITVSSMFLRLFHRVLAHRIRQQCSLKVITNGDLSKWIARWQTS